LDPQTNWALDPNSLRLLERELTDFVEPIARILVSKAIDRSRSTKEPLSELALRIPDAIERERFRREADLLLRLPLQAAAQPGQLDNRGGSGTRLTESDMELAQAMLAQFLGPIACVLVRRAANNVSSVEALWQTLAMHIDSPSERAAFLRQRQM
jgi:serine/threonine-protein kinase